MLLNEMFQSYVESDNQAHLTNPILNIPTKLINILPDSKESLNDKQRNKIRIVASKLRSGEIKDTHPIKVKKTGKKFTLVYGLVRLLAYQRAGIPAIPAEIVPSEHVAEARERYIIYINDKPAVYFEKKSDADKQAEILKSKRPNDKINIKLGLVNNQLT